MEYVGGRHRADKLSRIAQNSYPHGCLGSMYYKTREEVFRSKATQDGFTNLEVDAFLML